MNERCIDYLSLVNLATAAHAAPRPPLPGRDPEDNDRREQDGPPKETMSIETERERVCSTNRAQKSRKKKELRQSVSTGAMKRG